MSALLALIAVALGWAVWKRKLRIDQLLPILLGIGGAFLAARGNLLFGLGAIAIALVWYRGLSLRLFQRNKERYDPQAIDKARFMLGVSRFDNADYIRERHEALVAKIRTDSIDSKERAAELKKARDLLLHDVAQRDKNA